MKTKVAQRVAAGEIACRLRHEHLATVTRRRDPARTMAVHADVTLVREQRLAGMDSDPLPNGSVQRRLRVARCRQGIRRTREGDEERIPLCVYLHPGVLPERLPQHPPMFGERLRVLAP